LSNSRQVPRIKLLQRAEIRTVFYRSCLISVDYLITRCSAFDDSQVVEGGFFSEILILGAARCAELHQKQVYLFPTGGIVTGLKTNRTITATHTLIGTLDREGNCQEASYSSDKGTWKNVVVQSNYKIYLGEGIANLQTKENILIMPTGTRLKLSELYGLDTFKGEVIWSNDQILQSCDRTEFDVFYDGPASVIVAEKLNPSSYETHTYMVKSENIVFALKKIKKNICMRNTGHTNRTSTIIHFNRLIIHESLSNQTNPTTQHGPNGICQYKICLYRKFSKNSNHISIC